MRKKKKQLPVCDLCGEPTAQRTRCRYCRKHGCPVCVRPHATGSVCVECSARDYV